MSADAFAAVFGSVAKCRRVGAYRTGYTRALEDVVATLRRIELGVSADELANVLGARAAAIRRSTSAELERA